MDIPALQVSMNSMILITKVPVASMPVLNWRAIT